MSIWNDVISFSYAILSSSNTFVCLVLASSLIFFHSKLSFCKFATHSSASRATNRAAPELRDHWGDLEVAKHLLA